MVPREGVVEGHRPAAVLVVLRLARARLAAALLARVDGVRPDDVEARQQVLRRGPQDGHADATHHTSVRARDAGIRVLPPERAMVACSDGAAEAPDERGEGLVDLAVVAEDEGLHLGVLLEEVPHTAALAMLAVVQAPFAGIATLAARQARRGARRAAELVALECGQIGHSGSRVISAAGLVGSFSPIFAERRHPAGNFVQKGKEYIDIG